jgi:hypothetical protein
MYIYFGKNLNSKSALIMGRESITKSETVKTLVIPHGHRDPGGGRGDLGGAGLGPTTTA